MMRALSTYTRNLQLVMKEIQLACERSGRSPEHIRIVTVTKTVGPDQVPLLLDAGLRQLGENRWQQAKPKLEEPRAAEAEWHFIGRLQTNKLKYVVPHFQWIHSLTSVDLGQAVSHHAVQSGKVLSCLLQVNVSGEDSKAGVSPDDALEAVKALSGLVGIQVCGLMTMAPAEDEIERTRPVFRDLSNLLRDIRQQVGDPLLKELSMGMSNDFTVAVEEGATMVRIGRKLLEAHDD